MAPVQRNVWAAASSVRSALISVIELTRIEFLSNLVSCMGGRRDLSSSKYLIVKNEFDEQETKTKY